MIDLTNPKPGPYPNVTVEQYDRIDAVRSTLLQTLCDGGTPSHCRSAMLRGEDREREAVQFGVGYHLAVLEPDSLERRCVEMIPGPFRSNAAKAAKADFLESHRDRIVLEREDKKTGRRPFELLKIMRDKLWSHPDAAALLKGKGQNELTLIWEDELGPLCKARLDRVTRREEGVVAMDLKSARPPIHQEAWGRTLLSRGYYRQAAFYVRAMNAVWEPLGRPFYHIVQENEPPYEVAVYELGWESIDIGMQEIEHALETYQSCVDSGEWPGFPHGIRTVNLPPWRMRPFEAPQGKELDGEW